MENGSAFTIEIDNRKPVKFPDNNNKILIDTVLTACGTPLSSTSLLLIVGVCGISHGLNEFHDDERRWRKCTNQRFEAFDLAAAFFSVATPGDEVLAVLEQDIVAFVSKLAHSSFYNSSAE